ncbi:MAG: HD-GYP domain protein, partial [Lachnospiraceae bacterium]|nr:HD-GYP domain protein [Lachnospiraceae bacterium]
GTDIPEEARIICLADSYDAMTSKRSYSSPKAQSEVRKEIIRCSGSQFDPQIAVYLIQMIDEDKDFLLREQPVSE